MSNSKNEFKREDDIGEIISINDDEEPIDIEKLLKTKYEYIYESMISESIQINVESICSIFKEVVYQKEVVGFVTYNMNFYNNSITLTNIYVLPKYRGNDLLGKELYLISILANEFISIESPNRFIIESLIKTEHALQLSDNIIISSIPFNIPLSKVFTKKEIKTIYENMEIISNIDLEITSMIYDLDMCGVLFLKDNTFIDDYDMLKHINDDKTGYISQTIDIDDKNFNCKKQRRRLRKTYYTKVNELIKENEEKIMNFFEAETQENKSDLFSIEELVGTADELSPYILNLIENEDITLEDAFKIRQQLIDDYDNNKVKNYNLPIRLHYFIKTFNVEKTEYQEKENRIKVSIDDKIAYYEPNIGIIRICPTCKSELLEFEDSCEVCGYNINEDFNLEIDKLQGIKNKLEKAYYEKYN